MTKGEAIQKFAEISSELGQLLEEHVLAGHTRPAEATSEFVEKIRDQKEAAALVLVQLEYE